MSLNTHQSRALSLLTLTALILSVTILPATARGAVLVNTEAFSIIDDRDATANVVLKFGETLNKTLTYDRTLGRFQLSAGLSVLGTISGSSLTIDRNASISGALLVKGGIATKATLSGSALTVMGGNSYVLGNVGIGTSNPTSPLHLHNSTAKWTNSTTANGSTIGLNGVWLEVKNNDGQGFGDPITLYNNTTQTLTAKGGNVGIGTSSPDTKLEVIGTISGTTLNANTLLTGSTLQGFGLYNCQGTSNKLTYNSTTKKFLCESDQAGSSYTAGQGLSLNGSSFSVNATLTGSLAKFSTLSGYVVHAKNALSSSGTLRVVGAGTFDGSLTFGDAIADAITVNASTWTFANDTNVVLSGGVNGLSFDTSTLSIDATNDRVGIGTTAPKTTLDVVGTVSGSAVWGYNLVNSQSATSGSILVSRQNNVPEWKSPISSLVWFLDGVAVQAASQGATVTMPYGMSLSSVTLRAKNAPTGAALIVDINENGTTLFGTRPQINAGATTGGSSAVFSDTTLAAGSDITVDFDQIGSTVAGSGVTIMLNGVRRY